jgi:hypothetical protein
MPSREIENPIVNGPYDKPARHFRFDDEGITSEIVDKRRLSICGLAKEKGSNSSSIPNGRGPHGMRFVSCGPA